VRRPSKGLEVQLTKYVHACVVIADGDDEILIDPGVFTPGVGDLVLAANTILITHEHADHVDVDAISGALDASADLRVYGPDAVVARWREGHPEQVVAVVAGDAFVVGELTVEVYGDTHAEVHPDYPRAANVGYLVGGRVFHPGDSYQVPVADVEVLLLPTSGPWTKLSEGVEFVRAVAPRRIIQIHEALLSDQGQRGTAMHFSPERLVPVTLEIVPPGETLEV